MFFNKSNEITAERLRVIKFLLIGFILLGLFTGLKGCTDSLPSWLVGPSKQELAVKSEVLTGQLVQAQQVIEDNAKNDERVQDAKVVSDHVLEEVRVTVKKEKKTIVAKKKIYSQAVDKVILDESKTEAQKTTEVLDVSIDAVWDAYDSYIGDRE